MDRTEKERRVEKDKVPHFHPNSYQLLCQKLTLPRDMKKTENGEEEKRQEDGCQDIGT